MCCQESGERLAVVSLECPNSSGNQPKARKVLQLHYLLKMSDDVKHLLIAAAATWLFTLLAG